MPVRLSYPPTVLQAGECAHWYICAPLDWQAVFNLLLHIDGNLVLAPLVSCGVKDNEAHIHAGFLILYNSVHGA
jgi:hypothetical protein